MTFPSRMKADSWRSAINESIARLLVEQCEQELDREIDDQNRHDMLLLAGFVLRHAGRRNQHGTNNARTQTLDAGIPTESGEGGA